MQVRCRRVIGFPEDPNVTPNRVRQTALAGWLTLFQFGSCAWYCYLFLVLVAGLALPARARRASVLFFAAASDAFFARAERSSGVMFFAAIFPPSDPVLRAISAMASRTSRGILIAIATIVIPKYLRCRVASVWPRKCVIASQGLRCDNWKESIPEIDSRPRQVGACRDL